MIELRYSEGWTPIPARDWEHATAFARDRGMPVRMIDYTGLIVREFHPMRRR